MKKLLCLCLAALLALGAFAACAPAPATSMPTTTSQTLGLPEDYNIEGTEVAFLATEAQRDRPFGQTIWSTIARFCGEEGIGSGAFTVDAADPDAALATLGLAAKGGVKLVVGIGAEMTDIIAAAGEQYPDVHFVLMEGEPEAIYSENTTLVWFEPAQAGWLAGYAAVAGGERALLLLHGDGQRRAAYNAGFALGAAQAAAELALEPAAVRLELALLPEEEALWPTALAALLDAEDKPVAFAAGNSSQAVVAAAAKQGAGVVGIELVEGPGVLASVHMTPAEAAYRLMQAWQAGKLGAVASYGLADELYVLVNYALEGFTEQALDTLTARFNPVFTADISAAAATLTTALLESESPAEAYGAWNALLEGVLLETVEFSEEGQPLRQPPANGNGYVAPPVQSSSTTSLPEAAADE